MSTGASGTSGVVLDRLLTLQQVAERLAVSLRSVYRLMAEGELPQPVKVLGCSRIPEGDVVTLIEKLKRERRSC